jgi:hypothetical protein
VIQLEVFGIAVVPFVVGVFQPTHQLLPELQLQPQPTHPLQLRIQPHIFMEISMKNRYQFVIKG